MTEGTKKALYALLLGAAAAGFFMFVAFSCYFIPCPVDL
jgi:hypothetical protein